MSKTYSRDYENELLNKLLENGITHEDLVSCFLNYLSSDETCAVLEDACDTYDIDYEED